MECPACHTANPENNRFCGNCGEALSFRCATCGFVCTPRSKFCGGCGSSLAGPNIPHPEHGSAVAPALGSAELKQATVLFADIVSSTELVADLDPEEAMGRLRPAVARMRQSVERFGGTVVRTLGDGIMALFGVPLALEGHALLACQAALHMQQAFKQGADGLSIRVGLHSGQVASDPEDARDGHGGGAHGFTIHLASRIIALAQPGEICLTEACRVAAGAGCETEPMGPHRLKGVAQPISILRLAGAVSGAPHRTLMPETTFRGRQRELQRLVTALDEARANASKVVGVSGEPGAGKSRLCQELARVCRERGVPVHEVRAQLYGHALPLQPILELFRVHFFGLASNDDAAVARERIDTCFAQVSSGSDLQLLHEFFGVPPPDAPPLALGPRARQTRLLALVRELIRHQAQVERVILIEDMHWLDEASEEFVSTLVEAVVGTRTLLLLNYRTAYRAPWKGATYFEEIGLVELSSADMDALVAELLAPLTALPDIAQLVCRRAGGNPFFAEELARTLAESNLISADTGLPGGLEALELALPATIEAVVGARLDRLGEPEKTLLQMCSIIGKEIPLAVLEHVASPIASEIQIGLEGLCEAGLILPQPADGGRRFAFRHPLIQEVAYRTQLKVRRGQVHASVAAAMELYYAERIDEYAALVGYHFERAEKAVEAARYNARAASWIGAMNAAQAIKHWRKARTLALTSPSSTEANEIRLRAASKIAWLGWRQGVDLQEMRPLLDEAIRSARARDLGQTQLLLMVEGRVLHAAGESADFYVERVLRAIQLVPDAPPGRAAVLHTALTQAYGWAGMLREALAASDIALAGVRAVDPVDSEFMGFSVDLWLSLMRARLLARIGRFEEARASASDLIGACAVTNDPVIMQMPHYTMLELGYHAGDFDVVQRHRRIIAELARQTDTPYVRVFALRGDALMHRMEQRADKALAALTEALVLVKSKVAVEFESELLADLCAAHYAAGEVQAALQMAQDAVALSRLRGNRLPLIRALATWRDVVASNPSLAKKPDEQAHLEREIADLVARTGVTPVFYSQAELARGSSAA